MLLSSSHGAWRGSWHKVGSQSQLAGDPHTACCRPALVGGQWETEGLGTGEGAWTLGMEVRGERGPVSATRTGGQPLCSWTPAACGFPTEDHPLAAQQKPLLLCAVLPEAESPPSLSLGREALAGRLHTARPHTRRLCARCLFRGQRPPCAWLGAPGWSVASSCCCPFTTRAAEVSSSPV